MHNMANAAVPLVILALIWEVFGEGNFWEVLLSFLHSLLSCLLPRLRLAGQRPAP